MEDSGIILAGSYDTLKNSEIAFSAGNGVTLLGDHHTVTNNLIHDVAYAGVDDAAINTGFYGTASTNHQITYNTLYNSGRGLLLFRNATGLKITHNDLYNSGLQTTDSGAMYTYNSDGAGTEIAYNLVHDAVNYEAGYGNVGIYLDNGSSNYVVHHNMVWNTQVALMLNDPSTNNLVYNNTLAGAEFSLAPHATMPGTQIKNNIFTNWIDYSTGPTLSNNLTRDIDPQFVDTASNNFQLRSTSPAIDAGAALSPYTNGYSGAAPDIGAYEFGQPPWSAGATLSAMQQIPVAPTRLSTTVVSASQINLSWQDNSSNETRFVIERSSDGKLFKTIATIAANVTSYSDVNRPLGTYTYRVRADNGTYTSGYSNRAVAFTGRNAYATIEAQTYDAQSGTSSWWSGVGSLDAGDWLRYNKVDFGTGGARAVHRRDRGACRQCRAADRNPPGQPDRPGDRHAQRRQHWRLGNHGRAKHDRQRRHRAARCVPDHQKADPARAI